MNQLNDALPMNTSIQTIDEYILQYPKNVQALLKQMRKTIKAAAPQAEEAIKYGLPTFVLEGNLVHFGGFKEHIGFYPAPSGIKKFEKELARFEKSKGAIRFPIESPLPLSLISKIVAFRIKENLEKRKPVSKKKSGALDKAVIAYHQSLSKTDQAICISLSKVIAAQLPHAENKVWHRHPVWFLDGNPIVGYSKLKDSVRLLFWSGQSFDEPGLQPEGSFMAAEARFTDAKEINAKDLKRWLGKSIKIQWDYKNIVKRRGKLIRLQ